MPSDLTGFEAALADRYAVERELGQGGMATVYLARDLKHNRPVAIKVLKPELAASLGPDRFLDEIEITASLQHPHILPLYDSGKTEQWLYYVMPYVEGESLRDYLDRMGPLEVEEAVSIAREVADALAYAHERGVIHRDIKPGNILLIAGHAVVADFGIARAVTEAGGEGRTKTGAIVGSPAYMSPEQAKDDPLDGRADQYALACVLYELLTGEPPFAGRGLAVLARHVHDDAPSVAAKRADVPAEVDPAIRRALAKAPDDRYPTARDFGEALRGAVRSEALRRRATLPATLATYAAAGFLIFQVVASVTRAYLLPDWVPQGAIALLLAGLPVYLVTGFLHRKKHHTVTGARRLFSWRNALAGGVVAFGALGLGAGGYVASRALGVGPAATLVARGVFDERDPLILADFGGTDSTLARTATEALRIDLARSETVTLMLPDALRDGLVRMQADPDQPLEPRAARELAIREGVKGVITGSIHSAGDGFLLSVQLVAADDGNPLVSERETADGPAGFFTAIDKLSAKLRERLGESVRSIRSSSGLERYTTGSLAALEKYTAGLRAEIQGDNVTALTRYEEAVDLDSTFAVAHRKIAIVLRNRGEERARMLRAATRAYDLRGRLPELERLFMENMYAITVTGDIAALAAAEERISEIRGFVTPNLGQAYLELGDYSRAEEALQAATDGGLSILAPSNLWKLQANQGRFDDAAATLDVFEQRTRDLFPERSSADSRIAGERARFAAARGQYEEAATLFGEQAAQGDQSARVAASRMLAYLAAIHGRLREAEGYFADALGVHEQRGLRGEYLVEVVRLAELDLSIGRDGARALQRVEEALSAHPLDSLPAHDRPYEDLARIYAAAGEPNEARSLLAAFESEIRPRHLGREHERVRARVHAALVQGDGELAFGELGLMDAMIRRECRPYCTLPLLGQAYEMTGQPDSAIAAYERYLATPGWNKPRWDALYLASVTERLAQLYDERGDLDKAALHYARFVELWADADDVLRPRVDAAQRRLEEILAERG